MEKCIAREVSAGDRIQIALEQYMILTDPDFIDDDRVRIRLINIETRERSFLDLDWRSILNVVTPVA